jgi:hypothetical protein
MGMISSMPRRECMKHAPAKVNRHGCADSIGHEDEGKRIRRFDKKNRLIDRRFYLFFRPSDDE